MNNKNKLEVTINICLLVLFFTGLIYIIAWLIRPTQFLNFTIGVPHFILFVLLSVIVLLLIIIGVIREKKITKRLIRNLAFFCFVIILYAFIFNFFHPISVSELILENNSGIVLNEIVISYPGDEVTISKIEANKCIKIPIIPNNEGLIEIKGIIGVNQTFEYNIVVLECCSEKFMFKFDSSCNLIKIEN